MVLRRSFDKRSASLPLVIPYVSSTTSLPSNIDFKVDTEAEIKWEYRGDIREYFNESEIV